VGESSASVVRRRFGEELTGDPLPEMEAGERTPDEEDGGESMGGNSEDDFDPPVADRRRKPALSVKREPTGLCESLSSCFFLSIISGVICTPAEERRLAALSCKVDKAEELALRRGCKKLLKGLAGLLLPSPPPELPPSLAACFISRNRFTRVT
jgi:hypothetical protein